MMIMGVFALLVFIRVKPDWALIAALLTMIILIGATLSQSYDVQIMIVPK